MPEDNKQGSIHSAADGGVIGKHADPDPSQLLVAPSTSSEFNTSRLRLIPIACFRIDDVRFKFDSSFVLPETQAEIRAFADLRKSDPRVDSAPISIFGHADPSYRGNFELGSSTQQSGDDYNKTLSGRRAIAIYALLIRDPSFWNTLYTNHLGGDIWGEDSIRIMLELLDPPRGSQQNQTQSSSNSSSQSSSDSAQNSRVHDIANDSGQRQQLFLKYMNLICGDLKLDKSADFLARGAGPDQKGDVQGCGRFNPMLLFSSEDEARFKQTFADKDETTLRGQRDPGNAPNRRVMILIFRKGSQILPAKWPCPSYKGGASDCKKRFFSDGDTRRSTHESGSELKFDNTHDTFACRFYQRISDGSPCEAIGAGNDCFIYLKLFDDSFETVLTNKPYKISGLQSGWSISAASDANGIVLLENIPDDHYELDCDGNIETVEVFYLDDKPIHTGKPWFMRVRGLRLPGKKDG